MAERKTKDHTTREATTVNDQLINASGTSNAEAVTQKKQTTDKGEKNKKTTEGTIPGKEKAKNTRKESLPDKDSDPDKSDPKSNRDTPKADKTDKNDNKKSGTESPKKKDAEKKSK